MVGRKPLSSGSAAIVARSGGSPETLPTPATGEAVAGVGLWIGPPVVGERTPAVQEPRGPCDGGSGRPTAETKQLDGAGSVPAPKR